MNQGKPHSRGAAMSRNLLIPILFTILMVNSWGSIVENVHFFDYEGSFSANSAPEPNDDDYTDFGNGSAANSFWVGTSDSGIQDTWLGASQPDTSHGSDSELRAGFSANASSRWNTLFGIDLNQAGMYDNVTIQSATLALYVKQLSGQPTIRSWICYDKSWDASTTHWNAWSVGGALGNQDSGNMMDKITITNQGWIEIDVTEALLVSHYLYRTGTSNFASILLTGAAWGEEWASFHSSEHLIASERPHLNVTYSWGTSTPSSSIQWVDVYPKAPHLIDADNQLTLEAQARNGLGQTASGTVSWSTNRGSIDSAGIFTPFESGITQIDATIGGVTGLLHLQVAPGTPVNLDLETKSIALTIDDTFQFNWTFTDANGNGVNNAALAWYADYGTVNQTGFYQPTAIGQDLVTVMWQSLFVTADVEVSAGVASVISIEPNLSVASGEQIPLVYTVTDQLGNPLPNGAAGAITWETENGYVDGVGIYTGDALGSWRVNATSTSGATGHTYVEVTHGALSSIELMAPNGSQAADQPVLLIVNWLDIRGNNVPVRIPLSNWTAEDGNFRMTPEGVEWLPRREGDWKVGVHIEDQWANTTVNVVHGSVDHLLITSDTETISADAALTLQLMAEDSKGNRWPVNGTWYTMEPEAAPWLAHFGDEAQFSGNLVGNWTIRAEYSNFSSTLTLEVVPGSLAKIELQGDGGMISADGWHNFEPRFFDEDNNELNNIQLNWTFQHSEQQYDRSGEMRSNDGVWYPVLAGHHEIEVEAAGVFASLGIDVAPGIAHTLRALQTNGVVVQSGNITEIQVNATDLDGNDFGTDVIWTIPHNSVQLTNGTRAGEYLLRGVRAGSYSLLFHSGLADSEIKVIVQLGEVINLDINIVRQNVKTGEIIDVEIIASDFGGNKIEFNPDDVTLHSSAGNFGHSSGNFWQMVIENSGTQQRIEANYGTAKGEAFIDVSADPLRAFGDSSLATSLWTAIAGVVLLFILLLFILKSRSRQERAALEYHFGSKESEDEKLARIDPMAGYKPSKKARAAALEAFNQRHPQLGHASWTGYNQAQMTSPVAQQMYYGNMQMQTAATDQVAPQPQLQPQQQMEQTQQITPEPQEEWPNNTLEVQGGSEAQLDEAPWTTEQVWEWGRNQEWDDGQIAAYEQIYDQSVRNPPNTDTNIEPVEYNLESVVQTSHEVVPESETVVEAIEADITHQGKSVKEREDVRDKGVMKAMPGTVQGESGWYLDGEGNPSRWDIDGAGQWNRTG